jgi:co-chaperonin GroES (HSP10)
MESSFDTLNEVVTIKSRMTREVLEKLREDGFLFEEIDGKKVVKPIEPNEWGFTPIGVKVLIEVEEVEKFAGKDRVIIIPDSVVDKFQVAQIKGKIVAVGGDAFFDVQGVIPKGGDKVYFAKYAGVQMNMDRKGEKRREGRVVNDKDIIAILDPETESIGV